MTLACEANAWGQVVGTAGSVTDPASAHYLTPVDLSVPLEAIAAAGFAGVEFFDGNLLPFEDRPAEFTGLLKEFGLDLTGVYSGGYLIFPELAAEELRRFDRSIAIAAECGATHFVVGGGSVRSTGRLQSDYENAGRFLDAVAKRARKVGLLPSYHPHLGSIAEMPEQIDRLMAHTSIGICLDTAHIAAGGADVVATMKKYGTRLADVHVKDLDRATGDFLPLGEGGLPMPAILQTLRDVAYNGSITVELDGYRGDLAAGASQSYHYLRRLGFA